MTRPLREQIETIQTLLRELRARSEMLRAPDEAQREIFDLLAVALKQVDESATPADRQGGVQPESQRIPGPAESASEESFRSLFESSLDPVLLTIPDGRVLAANAAACQMFGRTETEICKLGRSGLVDQDDPRLSGLLAERAQKGKARGELTFVRGDGTCFTGEISSGIFQDRHGALRTSMVIRDVTERKRAEEALRHSEETTRIILENILDPLFITDGMGNFTYVCPNVPRLLGYSLDELRAMGNISRLIGEGFRESEELDERGECTKVESTIVDGHGRQRIFLTNVKRVEIGSGTRLFTFREITERKQAEEALRTLTNFNQAVLDALAANICVLDADGTIVAVNRAWREFEAANPPVSGNAEVGSNYFAVCEAVTGDDANMARTAARGLRAIGQSASADFTMEYPCHSPEQRRWFVMRATRLAADPQARIVVTHFNITERKHVEEALRDSEKRYRMVVEDQTEVICRFRADGTFTFVNEVFCRFFGKTQEELLGQRWQPQAVAADLPMIEAKLGTLSPDNPVVVMENRGYSHTGEIRWMQFVNRGLFDRSGRLLEIQAVGRDITDRKRAELALEELSRRQLEVQEEEQRQLARELHDEIGQLLTGLRLTLDTLAGTMPATGQSTLREAQEVVAVLIRDVHDLSLNLRPPVLDDFGLLPALLWMFERYTATTHVHVTFAHSGVDTRPCAPQLETAAYRIIQEALTNVARHAGVAAVHVTVWVETDRLLVRIEDRGRGFEPEVIDARESSGIPGMQERVRLLGGRLSIEATPGVGTLILADLPLGRDVAR